MFGDSPVSPVGKSVNGVTKTLTMSGYYQHSFAQIVDNYFFGTNMETRTRNKVGVGSTSSRPRTSKTVATSPNR